MSEGLMTEREWRRQYVRIARKRTDCWGAQCWKPKPRWRQNRRNWACLLLGALGIANMWAAIFADVGVMVLAVLNATRALYTKDLTKK